MLLITSWILLPGKHGMVGPGGWSFQQGGHWCWSCYPSCWDYCQYLWWICWHLCWTKPFSLCKSRVSLHFYSTSVWGSGLNGMLVRKCYPSEYGKLYSSLIDRLLIWLNFFSYLDVPTTSLTKRWKFWLGICLWLRSMSAWRFSSSKDALLTSVVKQDISSMASKPINIRWIITGFQPYWKIMNCIIL